MCMRLQKEDYGESEDSSCDSLCLHVLPESYWKLSTLLLDGGHRY